MEHHQASSVICSKITEDNCHRELAYNTRNYPEEPQRERNPGIRERCRLKLADNVCFISAWSRVYPEIGTDWFVYPKKSPGVFQETEFGMNTKIFKVSYCNICKYFPLNIFAFGFINSFTIARCSFNMSILAY